MVKTLRVELGVTQQTVQRVTTQLVTGLSRCGWSRGPSHEDLRCHSDVGSQFTSIRYSERLAEIGATSTGPWKTVEDLEVATLG